MDIEETDAGMLLLEGPHGITDTYTVRLATAPAAGETVTVSLSVDPAFAGQVTLSTPTLTFSSDSTAANAWNKPQTVTLSAPADGIVENQMLVPILHHITSAGGTNPRYGNLPIRRLKQPSWTATAPAFTCAKPMAPRRRFGAVTAIR